MSDVRPTNLTPREHYDVMLAKARARGEVSAGPLGIPGWRAPVRKATAKWMIQQGKWPRTEENLRRAGMLKESKPRRKLTEQEKLERQLARLKAENAVLRTEE